MGTLGAPARADCTAPWVRTLGSPMLVSMFTAACGTNQAARLLPVVSVGTVVALASAVGVGDSTVSVGASVGGCVGASVGGSVGVSVDVSAGVLVSVAVSVAVAVSAAVSVGVWVVAASVVVVGSASKPFAPLAAPPESEVTRGR